MPPREIVEDDLADAWEALDGERPSDQVQQDTFRVLKFLRCGSNDAITPLMIVLRHYINLYEKIPRKIEEASEATLNNFRDAAGAAAIAAAEAAKADLAKAVGTAARDVARDVATTEKFQWIGITATTFAIGGIGLYLCGASAGQKAGYVAGYEYAKDEVTWAATPEGQVARKLANATNIFNLAKCSHPGWKIKNGVCFPYRAPDKMVYGWRMAPQ